MRRRNTWYKNNLGTPEKKKEQRAVHSNPPGGSNLPPPPALAPGAGPPHLVVCHGAPGPVKGWSLDFPEGFPMNMPLLPVPKQIDIEEPLSKVPSEQLLYVEAFGLSGGHKKHRKAFR